jgi:hypothetical protein
MNLSLGRFAAVEEDPGTHWMGGWVVSEPVLRDNGVQYV